MLGSSNEDQVIVEKGLDAGEIVHLLRPEDSDNYKLAGEDLIPEIKERSRLEREEAERIRQEGMQARRPNGRNNSQMTPEQRQQMMQMRGSREGGQQEGAGGSVTRPVGQGQRNQ